MSPSKLINFISQFMIPDPKKKKLNSQLDALTDTIALLYKVVPFVEESGRNIGSESTKFVTISNYLEEVSEREISHVCELSKCKFTNEHLAMKKGYLPKAYAVQCPSVFVGSCGNVHICGNGGDLISPCQAFKSLASTECEEKTLCAITGQPTKPPPGHLFDEPCWAWGLSWDRAIGALIESCKRGRSLSHPRSAKRGRAKAQDAKRTGSSERPRGTTATPQSLVGMVVDVKSSIVPFRKPIPGDLFMESYGRTPVPTRKKKGRGPLAPGTTFNGKKQDWQSGASTENNSGVSSRVGSLVLTGERCEPKLPRAILGEKFAERSRANEPMGRGVDVRTRAFFNRNFTRVVEPGCKIGELDEFVFGYFRDPENLEDLQDLFREASRSPHLGEKKNRLSEAKAMARRLFYGEDRRDKIKYETYVNHRCCLGEVYRFCCTKLEMGKNKPLDFNGLDVLEFIPIIAKHFATANFDHQELLALPPSMAFIDFYATMCWVQWCLVCLGNNATSESSSCNLAQRSEFSGEKKNFKGAALNYPGCCITTMFDLSNGFSFGNPTTVMIPRSDYIRKYSPPMNEIAAYGYKKKVLTIGMTQRTRAYRRLAETGELQKLYKVYFEDLAKFNPTK